MTKKDVTQQESEEQQEVDRERSDTPLEEGQDKRLTGKFDPETFEEVSFLEAIYAMPVCCHTSQEITKENLGYTQGILVDGIPFEAEIWSEGKEYQNLMVYLPQIEELEVEDDDAKDLERSKETKGESNKICDFHNEVEVIIKAVLCSNMVDREIVANFDTIANYVEYLESKGVVSFYGDMRNGFILYLTDEEGNDVVAVSISLVDNGVKLAETHLTFRKFPNQKKENKKRHFRVIK